MPQRQGHHAAIPVQHARMASINDRAIVAVAEVIQICSVKRQEVLGD
jgi:hypothetical protein